MRKLLSRFKNSGSTDINSALIIKVVSDWGRLLKKISPIAGPLFILLNVQSLLRNKKALITLVILVPLLIIHPQELILRLIFGIAVMWIFLDKFSTGLGRMNRILAVIFALYALVIFGCILRPDFYIHMDDGSLRYKFMLESHNALCILVFAMFIYLCETLFEIYDQPDIKWLKTLVFVSICSLTVTFLFIKSRLYIGMSLGYLIIVSIKQWKRMRVLAVVPALYLIAFAGLTQFAKVKAVEIKKDSLAIARSGRPLTSEEKREEAGSSSGDNGKELTERKLVTIVENDRLLKSNATGRGKLTEAVIATKDSVGWQRMIYGYNVDPYMYIKAHIPNIDVKASSLTENSYFTTVLVCGIIGLALYFYLFGTYALYFIKQRQIYSLAFFGLLLGVWYFEETVAFTFSLITHLLALASISNLEKKENESRLRH